MSDEKKGDHGGGPPDPMRIFGVMLAVGVGVMLVFSLVGSGLASFGHSVADFSIGFRIGKSDFIQLLLYLLGVAGIALWIFGPKGGGGGHH